MALLLGIEVPAHVAFLGEIGNTGSVASPPLSQTLIETAHEHGITTIVTGW
jgi:predicted ATP-dependent serine protease